VLLALLHSRFVIPWLGPIARRLRLPLLGLRGFAFVGSITAPLPLSALLWRPELVTDANAAAAALLLAVFVWGPVIDYAIGNDRENFTPKERRVFGRFPLFLWLLVAALPLQVSVLFASTRVFVENDALAWYGRLAWLGSIGTANALMSIVAAHELIHRPNRVLQWVGGLLLAGTCYGGFKIEHVRGHHVDVGTDADASSAKLGESVYTFVPTAVMRNLHKAWQLEVARLARHGVKAWSFRNELLWLNGASAAYFIVLSVLYGWSGGAFFLLQSVVAVFLLEIINYIEHYGLRRTRLESGRFEPVTALHSWNSGYLFSSVHVFNLQRHPDHHLHPTRPYQTLDYSFESPQLPGGYASMTLLALVPPLWRLVIHPRLTRHDAGPHAGRLPTPRLSSAAASAREIE
jgi:alkane 1-monooxygenase